MYKVRFYRSRRGEAPVETYMAGMEGRHRRKVLQHLELLAQEGPHLRRPYADVLRGAIRELRVSLARFEHRVLYCFVKGDVVVLLHGFLKKTPAVPPQEIATAEARMKDLHTRLQDGEVLE